jgi:ABC-type phosphate transport system substrate-binding protein
MNNIQRIALVAVGTYFAAAALAAYAKQNKMAFCLLTNKAGAAVAPSAESFQAAAANADWAKAQITSGGRPLWTGN